MYQIPKKIRGYRPVREEQPAGLRTILPYNDSLYWIRSRNNAANAGFAVFNINQKYIARASSKGPSTVCLPVCST